MGDSFSRFSPLLSFLLYSGNGKGDVKESMLAWTHVVPVTMLLAVSFPPPIGRILMTCGVPFWIRRLNAQCGSIVARWM